MALKRKWHNLETDEALSQAKSSKHGLTEEEVLNRLNKFGPNELPQQKPYSKLRLFFNQFRNPLMYILLGTVAISLFLRHYSDTVFIVLVLISNVAVSYYQENKAGNAIQSLKKMVRINARVIRDNNEKEINSRELTVGDIIILHSGDKVPADARILESRDLQVNEASLTGESKAAKKKSLKLPANSVIAEQSNMLFMGTIVEEGWSKAVVTGIGLNTQMGEIVHMLSETEEALTPLQIQISRLAKYTTAFILFIIAVIFIIGSLRHQSTSEMLLAALSLAVSAIPTGLMPAITIILVLAMRRILRQHGLVRKLVSNETLGSVSVICTDKTGTLTEGKMEVTHLLGESLELSGKSMATLNIDDPDPKTEPIKQLVKISVLDNDAFLENPQAKPDKWVIRGKVTEQALLRKATQVGFDKKLLEQEHLLIDKIYFSSELKFSASLREMDATGPTSLFVVGAPEFVFSKSNKNSDKFEEKMQRLTNQGLRVVAVAIREFDRHPKYKKLTELVENLTLVGLIGLEDPVRGEVIEAIKLTKKAGIRTIIVTGDHKITAAVVAKKIGLKVNNNEIMEGKDLDAITDEKLKERVKSIGIFARVSPSHKFRIVAALRAHGEIVAMVGDGVNDAPALKSADIGVAVNSGTDVAKEVADLILLDNGFHTIVKAIEQGRVIFSNIRKVFVYLLADDFQEIYIFLAAMIMGLPLPLLPAQILWINLVEDGLPDIALTTEQETLYVMDQPPRPKNEPVVNRPLKFWLASVFLVSGTSALVLFAFGLHLTGDLERIRTMVFVLMGLDSLVFSFSVRSFNQIMFRKDIFSNKFLVGAVTISFILLITAVYLPGLQKLLSTQSLTIFDWIVIFGFSFVEIIFIEMFKTTFLFKPKSSAML
ncbi:MAG: HAD-IC family P-type ATPase [Candidatus Doudnabacteria bacterium]